MTPTTRDALKGAVLGTLLLAAYAVAADYPPQGGFAGGQDVSLTVNPLTLSNASANVGDLTIQHTPGTGGWTSIDFLDLRQDVDGYKRLLLPTHTYSNTLTVGSTLSTSDPASTAIAKLGSDHFNFANDVELRWEASTNPWGAAPDLFLGRSSAGVLRVGATTGTADGQVLCKIGSQDHTADDTLDGNDSHKIHTNVGDADLLVLTLPAGSAGYVFTVARVATQEVRIDPNASDKILDIDMTGLADGEYITTSADNSTITLVGTSTGDWIVTSKTGTWAEETP